MSPSGEILWLRNAQNLYIARLALYPMVDHQPYDQVCPGQISTPDHCNSVLKHPHLEPHPLSFSSRFPWNGARKNWETSTSALKIRWIRWISTMDSMDLHKNLTTGFNQLPQQTNTMLLDVVWLVVAKPSWKIWKSMWRMTSHISWTIKNVWNHQPVAIWIILNLGGCFIEQPAL